jgi:hypothetical protein
MKHVLASAVLFVGSATVPAEESPLYLSPNPYAHSGAPVLSLGWTPSTSQNAAGHYLTWGYASGQVTNQLDAGAASQVTVAGFTPNVTYYFAVVAYDDQGELSLPSNEIQYVATAPTARSSGPQLNVQLQVPSSGATRLNLTFLGSLGATYVIEATEDLQNWTAVSTNICEADGPVSYTATDTANYGRRFYRVVRQ